MQIADRLTENQSSTLSIRGYLQPKVHTHFEVLDGWRAISIGCVLIGHLIALGPNKFGMNEAIATTGMSLFFTLSGFLITKTLLEKPDLYSFAVRRLFRIVPLAWVAMLILLLANNSPSTVWISNLLFFSNNVDALIGNGGGHLWSLCVEMQIYLLLAILLALLPRVGLKTIPLLCLAVTLLRVKEDLEIAMVTWYRCDEILAGSILAIVFAKHYGPIPQRLLAWIHPLWLVPLMVICAHPAAGPLRYLRPYIAPLVVGATLYNSPTLFVSFSRQVTVIYLAKISYALYIIHGALTVTWLGSGTTIIKYSKRPLLFVITFLLAHYSTFKFEAYFIDYAKRLTSKNNVEFARDIANSSKEILAHEMPQPASVV